MTAEIDRRHIKIINDLIAYQRPLTSSFLASSLGLSDKTTRKLLSELSPVLAENGAELTAKAGSGYQITVLNNELFQKFHKQIHDQNSCDLNLSLDTCRAHFIVRELISANRFIQLSELSEKLFVNRTTTMACFHAAREILSSFDISVETKSHYGIRISGSEHNIRCCILYEKFFFQLCSLWSAERYEMLYVAQPEIHHKLTVIAIENSEAYQKGNLSDGDIDTLAFFLWVAVQRDSSGHLLEYDDDIIERFTVRNSYYTARILTDKVEQSLNYRLQENDRIFIAIYLISHRIYMKPEDFPIREGYYTSRDMALEIAQHLKAVNHFDYIATDPALLESLAMCLTQMVTRIEFHFQGTDYLLKSEFSLMSDHLALQTASFMQSKYRITIYPNDIFLLSMIIYPYFGRYPFSISKSKVMVVSRVNKSVAQGMAERLKRNFSRYIEQADVFNLYELSLVDYSRYEYMFSSVPHDDLPRIPERITVIPISLFFQETDKARIRQILVSGKAEKYSIMSCLNSMAVTRLPQCPDRDSCISSVSRIIGEEEHSQESLGDALLQSERFYPSEEHNNVVFLSAVESFCSRPMIHAFILPRPVFWNRSKIQIIVFWDTGRSSEGDLFENEAVPHILQEMFCDKEITDMILQNRDTNYIQKLMNKKYSAVLSNGRSLQ